MYVIGGDIGTFFRNLTSNLQTWGGYFIGFMGTVLLIVAVVKIVQAFVSHGRGQVNWLMIAGMLLVGGWLAATGFGFSKLLTFTGDFADTIEKAGTASGGGGTPTT